MLELVAPPQPITNRSPLDRGVSRDGALVYTRRMSKTSRTSRGDIMRRIAALHAKVADSGRESRRGKQSVEDRAELKKQIAALEKQMMAM